MDPWPLVGRSAELRRLRELVLDPSSAGVVLAAPAGTGKTRLALECLALADDAGLATVRVIATNATRELPFGALAPLLGPTLDGATATDRADVLRNSAAALMERAGSNRLVLFVDDAHNLDDLSAALVHQVAMTNAAFVLATLRVGEAAPDAITALWKDGLLERLELRGLTAEAVEELLSLVVSGQMDGAAAAQLAVRSQGNVLFLRELVVGALDDGTLRDEGGIWRLVGPLRPSHRLVELVESRLGRLDASERAVLEMVAFGEPLGPGEFGTTDDWAIAESLERQGLLVSHVDRRRLQIRLAHPLYGDVVRARISALREREITRRLAEAVERTGARRREDTLRVATFRLSGGGGDPDTMLTAALAARWQYDFALAQRLAQAALDAGGGFDAALLDARLTGLQGRGMESERKLADLAEHATTDAERGAVILARLDNTSFGVTSTTETWDIVEHSLDAIKDPAWRDEIELRRTWVLGQTQGARTTIERLEPLLTRAHGRGLIWASKARGYWLARLGQFDASLEALARGYEIQQSLGEPLDWYSWGVDFQRCLVLMYSGRFPEAEAVASANYHKALAERSAERQAWFAWYFVQTVEDRGHVRDAIRYGREATALFRDLDQPNFVRACHVHLALALALSGSAVEARSCLAEYDHLDQTDSRPEVEVLQSRAWTAVAGGALEEGRRLLHEAAKVGEKDGELVIAARALHSLARLGKAKQVVDWLRELTGEIEGELAAARLAHADSLSRHDPVMLTTASEKFEAIGADLLAAEAAADAAGAWRQAGEARRGAASERRAALLAGRCQGAVTPALQAIKTSVQLTPAEYEAALLAGAGQSNRQIAEQLFLSVRSVESRLQHVYEKLGIAGREELKHLFSTESCSET